MATWVVLPERVALELQQREPGPVSRRRAQPPSASLNLQIAVVKKSPKRLVALVRVAASIRPQLCLTPRNAADL